MHTRRHFLSGAVGAVGAGMLGPSPPTRRSGATARDDDAADQSQPSLCAAPQFVAEDLLRGEGFSSNHVRQIGRCRSCAVA